MKNYHVATGDGKGYYGVGYESYRQAESLLKISQEHDPEAHIVEEEYHFTNADRIRAMDDESLAQYLYALANKDFELDYCQNKPECLALVDTDEGVPEEHCRACLLQYLKRPQEASKDKGCDKGDNQKEEIL